MGLELVGILVAIVIQTISGGYFIGRMSSKLDSICENLKELKNNINALEKRQQDDHDQITIVKEAVKSAHHRLDEHFKKEIQ